MQYELNSAQNWAQAASATAYKISLISEYQHIGSEDGFQSEPQKATLCIYGISHAWLETITCADSILQLQICNSVYDGVIKLEPISSYIQMILRKCS